MQTFTDMHLLIPINSSNINEGIKAILFFKQKDFTRTKSTKSTKRKQVTFTQMFFMHIRSIKSTKRETTDFLLLRCFYAYKNAFFFVSHTKKAQKA